MSDQSVYKPGPMGWGIKDDSLRVTQYKEKQAYDKLAKAQPNRIYRQPVKSVNQVVYDLVKKEMAKDGIEGGFSCRHIERVVFGDFLDWLPQLIGSCFPAGTLVKLADGSTKPIEKLGLLDKVVTAEGNIGNVLHVMIRKYVGKMYHIKGYGHIPLKLTDEHPILTKDGYVKAEDIKVGQWMWIPRYEVENSNILLTVNHMQYVNSNTAKSIKKLAKVGSRQTMGGKVKVYRSCPDIIELDNDFGWLIGSYLSEGSSDGNKIVWTFNSNEEYTHGAKVLRILKEKFDIEGYGRVIKDKNTYKISVNSVIWSSLFKSLCGQGSNKKRIHSDLLCGGEEFMHGLWDGWVDGDGYSRDNNVLGTTVSKALAFDMYAIADNLGLFPKINESHPKAGNGVKSRKTRYNVVVTNLQRSPIGREDAESGRWSRVKSIETADYDGWVYNCEVEGDNSYIADGVGVHNCVASGFMRIVARRTLAESFILNEPEEIFGTKLVGTNNVAPFAPYAYRAGRNKGGINGNSDGSFCGAQIEGAMDFGILPCSAMGLVSDSFPEPQNTRTYKQWGANDTLMNKFKSEGRKFKLLESEKVTNYDTHWDLLANEMKPQMICSNWAFKPKRKHPRWTFANGDPVWIYTRDRSTSWAHNMSLDGAVTVEGEQFTIIDNSWGPKAHKNGSFFVLEADEMAQWIRQAEIQSIGDIDLKDSEGAV